MNKFATAINCMDGRVQIPVISYIKNNYGVDYVDMITLPGPDKILSENKPEFLVDWIKKCVEISISRHKSGLIAIIGHYDCAGNPVDEQTHKENILSAIETIQSWQFNVDIIGLWVDEDWNVRSVFSKRK
jgi:carbonic anhydrase